MSADDRLRSVVEKIDQLLAEWEEERARAWRKPRDYARHHFAWVMLGEMTELRIAATTPTPEATDE